MNIEETKKPIQVEQDKPFPTEFVDLPSKGLVYPESNPLSSGRVEIRYMTAKDEDILTSQNLIKKGIVIDELLKSVIISPINFNDLIVGDKNAIMFATRILGYGAEYNSEITCPVCKYKEKTTIKLNDLESKVIDFNILNRDNVYDFILPHSKTKITFRLLTHSDEKDIKNKLDNIKAYNIKVKRKTKIDNELSIRLKQTIISIDGKTDKNELNKFIDNKFLSRDTQELRRYIKDITPNIDLSYQYTCDNCDAVSTISIPMTVSFFWPDATI